MGYLDLFQTPNKPKRKTPTKPRQTRSVKRASYCDLCGKRIHGKGRKPYKFAVWCARCLNTHSLYPDKCTHCDGYHFRPGETSINPEDHMIPTPIILELLPGEESF